MMECNLPGELVTSRQMFRHSSVTKMLTSASNAFKSEFRCLLKIFLLMDDLSYCYT